MRPAVLCCAPRPHLWFSLFLFPLHNPPLGHWLPRCSSNTLAKFLPWIFALAVPSAWDTIFQDVYLAPYLTFLEFLLKSHLLFKNCTPTIITIDFPYLILKMYHTYLLPIYKAIDYRFICFLLPPPVPVSM